MDNLPDYFNKTLPLKKRVSSLLRELTPKEKFQLMSGYQAWWTYPIKRLKVPRMGMSDGPRGISFHSSLRKNTQFPVPKSLAATWNPDLSEKFGTAVAKEIKARGKHILLAPGINIDRTPLNGRTFEYFSEDPIFIREMVVPLVKSVQKQKVGACLKHYVANNQETNRHFVSVEIDERTLREIYLKAFEQIIKAADPWTVMSCYNRVNGIYGSEHPKLLREYLINEFGFTGFVMSDWGATVNIKDPERCVKAGLSLEMPKMHTYTPEKLQKALEQGRITMEDIDELIERILTVMVKTEVLDREKAKRRIKVDWTAHQQIAREIAAEGMVLLKNNNSILPINLKNIRKIAVLGKNASKKFGKFLYGGSAAVIPPFEITPLQGIREIFGKSVEITNDPKNADIALVITGLNHDKGYDGESFDKNSLNLPQKEEKLILDTAKQNPNTVVVLITGSPVSMEKWIDNVPAVVEAWYPGMMGGYALADILLGNVNPSGKLPITFPKRLSDSPAHAHAGSSTYPGDGPIFSESFMDMIRKREIPESEYKDVKVFYDEGIYVGYRYFDSKNLEPQFEFGFGLSYTKFQLSDLKLDKHKLKADDSFHISVTVENIGECGGAEVVQVYYSDLKSTVDRPAKELLGFKKVFVKAGESKRIDIKLNAADFAFFDVSSHQWKVEKGVFKILVGTSSRCIIFEEAVEVID
ncbi:MAG: glycosyl hydrolase [Promethearchaeia archaeon]|nr:MAG: glycosyl hydrolase [Candidatus Lokiarchaeia archaeon]